MAFKNQTSYAIGTRYGGLKVINQTDPTYSAGFPEDKGNLWDMVYIRHLNCYLYVQEDNQIHRKDIDEDPPCLFMGLDCGSQPGKFFKYSKLNRRLIVRRRDKGTAVVNLERKMVEIAIRKRQGSETIEDFQVFRDKENQIAWWPIPALSGSPASATNSRRYSSSRDIRSRRPKKEMRLQNAWLWAAKVIIFSSDLEDQ